MKSLRTLQISVALVPFGAGVDKSFHVLVNWNQYLSPQVTTLFGSQVYSIMRVIGLIEVIVAIGVMIRPAIFARIVGIWFLVVVVNLILTRTFYDIALRDFALAMASFFLASLSRRSAAREPERTLETPQRERHLKVVGGEVPDSKFF